MCVAPLYARFQSTLRPVLDSTVRAPSITPRVSKTATNFHKGTETTLKNPPVAVENSASVPLELPKSHPESAPSAPLMVLIEYRGITGLSLTLVACAEAGGGGGRKPASSALERAAAVVPTCLCLL